MFQDRATLNIYNENRLQMNVYKELIKGIRRIKPASGLSGFELQKYNLDPELYISHLKYELKYLVRFGSSKKVDVEALLLSERFLQVVDNLPKLIELVEEVRAEEFKLQKWRGDIIKHTGSFTKSKKLPVIEQKLEKAEDFSSHLLRRYLKEKQRRGEIPIPQLLPDVKNTITSIPYKGKYTTPHTNKRKLMEAAYDMEYIHSIILPSLEYDINKYHYLDKLRLIVEKGPYQVKIKTTSAGPISMNYINLPYNRRSKMKNLALDIKKLITTTRIKNVWDSKDEVKEEKMSQDGSYSIKGITMYPRSYYEKFALAEAAWDSHFTDKPLRTLQKEWVEHLNITSKELSSEIKALHNQKRTVLEDLKNESEQLQLQMDKHYDKQVEKYQELVNILKEKNVFKHGELVNGEKNTLTFNQQLGRYNQVGTRERVGLNMNLSDYLRNATKPTQRKSKSKTLRTDNFQIGYRFYDRFKFKI